MPVQRRFDFILGGKGFMLQRGKSSGRAWNRTGRSDAPGTRSPEDAKYGVLPDELDHPEVWDDWSGGFGHAYRRTGENTYHWAFNFDARFPKQLVHCQNPHLLALDASAILLPPVGSGGHNINVTYIMDYPAAGVVNPKQGQSALLVMSRQAVDQLAPTGLATEASAIKWTGLVVSSTNIDETYGYRAAVYGSHTFVPNLMGSAIYVLGFGGLYVNELAYGGCALAVAGNRMWRAFGATADRQYSLQSVGNQDIDAIYSLSSWSATINVGNGLYSIKDMIAMDDQLFVGMADGLYAGDQTGTFVNVLAGLQSQVHQDNCRDLTVHEGAVMAPHISGIYEYRASGYEAQVRPVGPTGGHRSPIHGRFRCLRSFGRWLYAGLYTGSQSYLMAGDTNRDTPIWHVLSRLPHTTKIDRIHVDGITTASSGARLPNRMWISTDASVDTSGTAPVYWWPIPLGNDNPLIDDIAFSANYIGSARMDLGNVNFGAPGTPKVYREVEVWADMLLSGYRYADVYYDVDNSGSFTLLGRANDSPKSTIYFPSGEGSFMTGQSIELSLQSFTASPAFTPIYRSIVLRGALQPRSVDVITAVVRIADGLRDRQGSEMRLGATMLQELRDFGNPDAQGLQAHQLIDLAGATQWVKVLGRIEEQEVWQQGDDNPEIAATVRMAVLTFS